VSQIVTFGTLAAKAAVRDVGRVLDLPYPFVDGIAKLIPFQPGKVVTLKRRAADSEANVMYAREIEPLINEREAAEEEVRQLLELAEQLEGLPRNVGMHAGGVLIAPGKLTDFCPLYVPPNADAILSQFDDRRRRSRRARQVRLPGLTTLTILDWTSGTCACSTRGDIDLEALPLTTRRRSRSSRTAIRPRCSSSNRAACAIAEAGAGELLRGHHRARRALPSGSDGTDPDYVARKSARALRHLDARLEPIRANVRRDGIRSR
jgi:DNA polymerase-3 subunit alpha